MTTEIGRVKCWISTERLRQKEVLGRETGMDYNVKTTTTNNNNGMVDHVTRCHPTDTAFEAGTERATIFKQGYTVSESEKRKVLTKVKIGTPRSRRDTTTFSPLAYADACRGTVDREAVQRAPGPQTKRRRRRRRRARERRGGGMRGKRRKRKRRGAETEAETETTTKRKRKKKKRKRKKKKKETKKETKTKMKTRRGKGVNGREGEGRVNGHGWGVGGVASYA